MTNHETTHWCTVDCRMQHGSKITNKDRPHAGILASTDLFLYDSQLRHATPVTRNYLTGLLRTISRTQRFYSALPGVRRRFTSLPAARYSVRLAQRGMLRHRRYFRCPLPSSLQSITSGRLLGRGTGVTVPVIQKPLTALTGPFRFYRSSRFHGFWLSGASWQALAGPGRPWTAFDGMTFFCSFFA